MIDKHVFVFYYEWTSTEGNHAGMAYLVRALKKEYPRQVVLIKEHPYQREKDGLAKLWYKRCWLWYTVLRLCIVCRSSDEIFFTEYGGIGWQTKIARSIKSLRPAVRRTGLMHLPLPVLKDFYESEVRLKDVLNRVNNLLVFGSSLERELKNLLVEPKVTRTFHYVDQYYVNGRKPQLAVEGPLQILFVGNLMRNYTLLQSVIDGVTPAHFNFHICGGAYNLKEVFGKFKHVNIYPYLEEAELLALMKKAEVSLNIFDDTIGSNVITTSMACGLPLVASDVGSIRDYADDNCSILCKNEKGAFINALNQLQQDRILLGQKSKWAIEKSSHFLLNHSLNFFRGYFQLN